MEKQCFLSIEGGKILMENSITFNGFFLLKPYLRKTISNNNERQQISFGQRKDFFTKYICYNQGNKDHDNYLIIILTTSISSRLMVYLDSGHP